LDLNDRRVYRGGEDDYRTENSISIGTDLGEVLIPTVVNGQQLTEDEAIRHYEQTGEHLGVFSSPGAADHYADALHLRQEKHYAPRNKMANPLPSNPLDAIRGFIDPRRSTLLGLASGLAQGNDWGEGMGLGFARAAQGRQIDDAYATSKKDEAERAKQLNYTIQAFQKAGRQDLVDKANAGFMKEAWNDFTKVSSTAEAPSSVREWEYFNALPPEQQSAYLRMKRANPYLDLGTGFGQPDPVNPGSISGPVIPKENFQEAFDTASGTASGKATTEAAMGAPAAIASAENSLAQIDAVINDPNLSSAIGLGGLLLAIPTTPRAGTVARIEQLQGAAFLQAFATLKGGGQITEVEGKKATDAIARLNRVQSKEDFVQALNDLKSVIQTGLDRAKAKLGASGGTVGGSDIDSILEGYGL